MKLNPIIRVDGNGTGYSKTYECHLPFGLPLGNFVGLVEPWLIEFEIKNNDYVSIIIIQSKTDISAILSPRNWKLRMMEARVD